MSRPSPDPALEFGQWDVESLRLTIFHSQAVPLDHLWKELVGTNPEVQNKQPRQGILTETGVYGKDNLALTTQPYRVDWNVLSTPSPQHESAGGTPILNAPEEGLPLLERALAVTLPRVSQVSRLAFGVVLLQATEGLREALDVITNYVPFLGPGLRSGSDLQFQINRERRATTAPHVRINRVCRWSVQQYHSSSVLFSAAGVPTLRNDQPRLFAKATLDINSAPSDTVTSTKKWPALYGELVEDAKAIAQKGDPT